ncbi:sulfotransferase 1A1-like isoform X2 [Babylonia areolata]|uniref:sulfotransferase 1A1-like isoform X2 n=1 Tax=Babylonia areolata TaxID=304850 RepID=UPI003FCFB127
MEQGQRRRRQVHDAGGQSLSLVDVGEGVVLCPLMEQLDLGAVRSCSLRPDDVLLCTYPRSGTHWTWELMRMLVKDRTDSDATEKEAAMLEWRWQGELESLPSPRILNSHLLFAQLPADVLAKGTKVVMVYRDPKDVAVSFYNLHRYGPWYGYEGRFEHWLPLFMEGKVDWGGYGEYLRDWERVMEQHPQLSVHLIAYEQLMEDPIAELTRLSRFLGKAHDVSFLQAVSDACAIDKMRERKKENYMGRHLPDDGAYFMYRKGGSGGWKEWFTVDMSEQFDRHWAQVMSGTKVFASLL